MKKPKRVEYDGKKIADYLLDRGKLTEIAESALYHNPKRYGTTLQQLETDPLYEAKCEKAFNKALDEKIIWVERNPRKAMDFFNFSKAQIQEYKKDKNAERTIKPKGWRGDSKGHRKAALKGKKTRYVVTIFDKNKGRRARYTEPRTKSDATKQAKKLRQEMRTSISEYQFAKDIRVERSN